MPKKVYTSIGYAELAELSPDSNYSTRTTAFVTSGPESRLKRACVVTDVSAAPLPRGCSFSNSMLSVAQKTSLMYGSEYTNDSTDGSLDFEVFLVSGDAVQEGEVTWNSRTLNQLWGTGGGDYFTRERGHRNLSPFGYPDGHYLNMRIGRNLNLSMRTKQRRADFICKFRYEASSSPNKVVGYTDNESTQPTPLLTVYYRKSSMRSRRLRWAR